MLVKLDYIAKPLLILDIDETLIHATKKQLDRAVDCKVFKYNVYVRPHLKAFMDQVKESYQLALWSSASDDYVHEVVRQTILSEYSYEFVWARSRATYRRNRERDETRNYSSHNAHYHYVKPLKKVRRQGYDLKRTLIVDDSPHKCMLNYGNAIYPKPYEGQQEDKELLLLAQYLLSIKYHPNYRKLEKRGWRSGISCN